MAMDPECTIRIISFAAWLLERFLPVTECQQLVFLKRIHRQSSDCGRLTHKIKAIGM